MGSCVPTLHEVRGIKVSQNSQLVLVSYEDKVSAAQTCTCVLVVRVYVLIATHIGSTTTLEGGSRTDQTAETFAFRNLSQTKITTHVYAKSHCGFRRTLALWWTE